MSNFLESDTLSDISPLAPIDSGNLYVKTFCGRVASGDQFINSREKKNWIRDTFDAYCTEMEGAAIAQAASITIKLPRPSIYK